MAKENNYQKIQSSKLNKSIEEFKGEIEERIRLARLGITKAMESQNVFQALRSEYSSWNDYNVELLKQSFDEINSEYRKSYEGAGELSGARIRTESYNEETRKIERIVLKLKAKIDNLEN